MSTWGSATEAGGSGPALHAAADEDHAGARPGEAIAAQRIAPTRSSARRMGTGRIVAGNVGPRKSDSRLRRPKASSAGVEDEPLGNLRLTGRAAEPAAGAEPAAAATVAGSANSDAARARVLNRESWMPHHKGLCGRLVHQWVRASRASALWTSLLRGLRTPRRRHFEDAWSDAGETDPLQVAPPGLFACYQAAASGIAVSGARA